MDWENAEDWENLPATLEELGINIPEEQLEAFIAEAKEAANALEAIDLEKLAESIKSLGKIINKLQSGEQDRNFSADDYNAIIERIPAMADQFVEGLDGSFTYIGNSLDDLTGALSNSLVTSSEQMGDQLAASLAASTVLKDIASSGTKADNVANY